MTYLLAYAPAKTEFAVAEAINEIGALAVCPRKVELVRLAKRRRPEIEESPVLPNYLFCAMSYQQWHQCIADRIIFDTVKWIGPHEWARVQAYAARVEQDYQHRMAQIEARERLSEYEPGDALKLLGGTFQGKMAVFRRMIEGKVPMIEAEMLGFQLLGRSVTVTVDPVLARKAAE